jgi:F-type H+-transporting ATPase subunit b
VKRLALCICFGLVLSATLPMAAQHETAAHGTQPEQQPSPIWLWANFAILAGALGYLIKKKAGPFFQSRSEEIRKGISEAATLKADAEARAAAIEQRMAGLEADIRDLRAQATEEINAEGERVTRETEQAIARTTTQAEQEIAAAAKSARLELKAYSAELALGLAEKKIRSRLTPGADAELLDEFLKGLERQSRGGTN